MLVNHPEAERTTTLTPRNLLVKNHSFSVLSYSLEYWRPSLYDWLDLCFEEKKIEVIDREIQESTW